jgi:hypothetical protein
VPADLDRVAQGGQHRLGPGLHLVVVGARQQQVELVAAGAGQRLAEPLQLPQPVGHRDQQLVAEGVAEAVVDVLEAVEVEQPQRAPALVAGRGQDEPFLEQPPVGKAGQGVVQRHVPHRLL